LKLDIIYTVKLFLTQWQELCLFKKNKIDLLYKKTRPENPSDAQINNKRKTHSPDD